MFFSNSIGATDINAYLRKLIHGLLADPQLYLHEDTYTFHPELDLRIPKYVIQETKLHVLKNMIHDYGNRFSLVSQSRTPMEYWREVSPYASERRMKLNMEPEELYEYFDYIFMDRCVISYILYHIAFANVERDDSISYVRFVSHLRRIIEEMISDGMQSPIGKNCNIGRTHRRLHGMLNALLICDEIIKASLKLKRKPLTTYGTYVSSYILYHKW